MKSVRFVPGMEVASDWFSLDRYEPWDRNRYKIGTSGKKLKLGKQKAEIGGLNAKAQRTQRRAEQRACLGWGLRDMSRSRKAATCRRTPQGQRAMTSGW